MLLRQFYNPTIATLHTNCTNNKHQPVYPFVSLPFLTQSPSCLVPFCSEKSGLIDDAIDAIQKLYT